MRADRLVSILMLLQSRGRVPARELAETLGVSVRTIYRDMDALSAAGIPVYAERGVDGGCCLVEDYRTDLTGLNVDEAHACLCSRSRPAGFAGGRPEMRSALHSWRQRLRVPGKPESPRPGGTWTGLRGARASPREILGVLYAPLRSEAWPGYRLDGLRSK